MKRRYLLLPFAVLGCAPMNPAVSSSASPRLPTRVEADGNTMELATNVGTRASEHAVGGSPDKVWPSLLSTYQELKIPIVSFDSTSRIIRSPSVSVSRTLAGAPLSRWLDCGRTAVANVPIADRYPVTLSMATQLRALGDDSTEIRTVLHGSAKSSTSNDPAVQCSTTGRLENRIAGAISD